MYRFKTTSWRLQFAVYLEQCEWDSESHNKSEEGIADVSYEPFLAFNRGRT